MIRDRGTVVLKQEGDKRQAMIECRPEVGISDIKFGYNTKSEGCATSMLDITELYAIMEEERLVAQRIRRIMAKNIGKDND